MKIEKIGQNNSNIIIRSFREDDAEEISAIEMNSFSMPWSIQNFLDLLKREYCYYLVAEMDGVLVGGCGMTISCQEGNIDNVVVDEAFRDRGIAQQMLRELILQGEKHGVKAFTLEVRVSNEPAIHVYEKLGFVSEGIRPRFYEKPVEDAMIMWRR